jgi:predicted O-methyltransferase YrrM
VDPQTWTAVDDHLTALLVRPDDALTEAQRSADEAGLPSIAVSAPQGKFLHLLARSCGARAILEIGTLGGYSTTWLARALPSDGRLVTLELDPGHAEVARANLERAGLTDRVEVRVGPALDTLAGLTGPFDLVFVDADKEHNAEYFAHAVRLSRPGTMIVVDNVVRRGAIADPTDDTPAVRGTRRLFDAMAAEPRVTTTVLQTVGAKGYDGLAISIVD